MITATLDDPMPNSLEKVLTNQTTKTADSQVSRGRVIPGSVVDLDVFGTKEIRDVLKSRAHCLRAGFPPNHTIIITLNEIRNHYILKVGLPTYLSQMLGELATVPIQACELYNQHDYPIKLNLNHQPQLSLLRFIAKNFQPNELPFKVEWRRNPQQGAAEVRYL